VEAQMLEHARTQGLPTTNEALGFLEQEKLWTSDDSAKLQNQEEYVTKLQHTFTTLLLDAQKKTMGAQLEVERKTLIRLQRQKASLLRDTCESYVQNKIGNETLFYSFYKDPTLKELYLSREDFEHLDPAELRVLAGLYNLATEHLDIERIKDLALDPLFVNYYSLASGSPHEFFRGKLFSWTLNQINLINYAKVFRNIIENVPDIPEHIKEDPDLLLDYAEGNSRRREMLDKSRKADGYSLMGATSQDLRDLHMENEGGKTLTQIVKEKDGKMDMSDFAELFGK
tara:strand:- start:67 stop:921 length:855 start_codon:yes stop_codon:yes gene_type:complete